MIKYRINCFINISEENARIYISAKSMSFFLIEKPHMSKDMIYNLESVKAKPSQNSVQMRNSSLVDLDFKNSLNG